MYNLCPFSKCGIRRQKPNGVREANCCKYISLTRFSSLRRTKFRCHHWCNNQASCQNAHLVDNVDVEERLVPWVCPTVIEKERDIAAAILETGRDTPSELSSVEVDHVVVGDTKATVDFNE